MVVRDRSATPSGDIDTAAATWMISGEERKPTPTGSRTIVVVVLGHARRSRTRLEHVDVGRLCSYDCFLSFDCCIRSNHLTYDNVTWRTELTSAMEVGLTDGKPW